MCPAVETVDPAWSLPMLPPGTQCYLIYSTVAMRGVQSWALLVSSVISLPPLPSGTVCSSGQTYYTIVSWAPPKLLR